VAEKKEATRVLDFIASEPWAMTEGGLRQMIAIANRETDVEAVEARLGKPLENTRAVSIRDGVAVIPVTGPIFQRANMFTRISGATSLSDLAQDFTAAYENPEVRAVAFAGDTPGGTVHIAEVARLVFERDTRFPGVKRKPVVTHFSGSGGSAGYWFGAASDRVYASATSSVGSVGTVLGASIPGKTKEGAERTTEFVYSKSPKKRVDLESPEGQKQVQTWVDDVGDVFVADVAQFRGISTDDVLEKFGQGDMLIASKALAAGMIDGIATLEEVIADVSAQTRKGNLISPRFAAKTTKPTASAKEKHMNENMKPDASGDDLAAQFEALKKQNEELLARANATSAQLQTEAASRIAAEVETFKAPLLAANDLRFNASTVGAYGNLLMVAKSAAAGLPTAKVGDKEIPLDVKTLGAFVAEQVSTLTASTARFTPPASGLTPPAASQVPNDVTLADIAKASQNPEASRKVQAAISARRATDPKYDLAALEADLKKAS
jgi:capsid assembly protease